MQRPFARVVAVLVVLVASHAPVRAAADARTEAAREHARQADAYYKLEKYPNAIGEYEQAYLAKPDASFLFNIAQCHRLMGHAAEAIKFYRRFLNDAAPAAPSRAVAEKHIRDLEEASRSTNAERPAAAPPPITPLPAAAPAPAPQPQAPPATGVGATTPVGLQATPPTSGVAATTPVVENSSPPTSDDEKPFYSKWWFWTAIGAVVVTGIVIGVVAAGHDPSCPEMFTCH